jgi:octaprenyl-diphosphate synthase
MHQLAHPAKSVPRPWQTLFSPIAEDLAAVEEMLRQELSSDDPFVDQLVKHAFRLGGKRLRPALLLLAAKASGGVRRDHFVLATVVEMIHTATLVHDDVLDEATLRRHHETINACSSNEASVLVGDFLFTHAFALASSLETTFACQVIGQATNTVCAGELRQIQSRGNYALSEAQYLSIIEDKTAVLCACCCRLGAHYAGADADVERNLAQFGRSLGIAFQVADDLLDLVGDERLAGKSLGTDVEKEKATLPLIRLLSQCGDAERQSLIDLLHRGGPSARHALAARLQAGDGLAYARSRAAAFAVAARDALSGIPWSPSRDVLAQLTEMVITRAE